MLKWLLVGLCTLLVVVVVLTGWVVGTRSGLNFAWSLVEPLLPPSIEVASVEGRLIGPLTVTGVVVDTASMHASVKRIHLEWQAADLLARTIHIGQLSVSGVDYQAKATAPEPEPEPEGEPFSLPQAIDLPVHVRVERLKLASVSVSLAPDAEPIVLNQALVKGAWFGSNQWRIRSLTAHGPRFDIAAQAKLRPQGGYPMRLSVEASLRPRDLAPIDTELRLTGTLEKLTLTQHVAAPYNISLEANITDIAFNALKSIGIDATLKLDETRLTAIRKNLPDVAPITSTLHIEGTPRKLTVTQTVAAPYNAKLTATLTTLLATPGIDARLTLNGTKLAKIRSDLPKTTIHTQVQVSGTPKDLSVTLDATVESKRFGRVVANGRVHYTPEAVTIETLRVKRPDTPMQLMAQGTVALAKGNAMDLTVQWQALRWPLGGQPTVRSEYGHFQLTGTLEAYQIDGVMQWQVAGQAAGQLQITGSGDMQSFHLAKLQISGGPGHIVARADIRWAPKLAVTAHIEGHHINPGAIVPKVPGDFSLVADIRAGEHNGVMTAHVEMLKAKGTLRGQPLALHAELAYLGDHVVIDRFNLTYGETTATVAGRVGWKPDAVLDLHWEIDSNDLSGLWPTLAGTLHTTGTVSGTVAAPSVEATLTARHLEYTDMQIASIDLTADIDWSGASRSQLQLEIADARLAGQVIHSLTVNLAGTPRDHTLEVDLDSETAQLTLALAGRLDKQSMVWAFTLNRLRAAYGEFAPWTLAGSASGQISAKAQRITDACLTSGQARLCVTGAHTAKGTKASLTLEDLAFTYAKPVLPENLTITGALSGTVDAHLPADGPPTVTAHLSTTAGRITTRTQHGETVQVLKFEPAQVDLTLADKRLEAALALPLAGTGAIKANLTVAAGEQPLMQRPLTGRVDIQVQNLEFVSRLVAEVAEIEGHITGNMRISGTLAAPRVLGELALQASEIVLLTPGLKLTDVRLAATGHGDVIDISMSAHSGGGTLSVDGSIKFGGNAPTVHLDINGKAFQVANTPMVRAWISPELDVKVTADAVRVTGRLAVPKARITPRDLPAAGAKTVADDTVIVTNKQSAVEAAARAIYANVLVVLGDVRFKGFGLKAQLNGKLRVQQSPGQPVTAAGKITIVEGSYRAYGQSLDIKKGHIYFAGGPISNAGIELRAVRYPAEDITVGVYVRGSVTDPKITLFSDPPMSQAETLSWLLLGQPLEGATGGQSHLLAKAALALGGGRVNKVLDTIGDTLGVDQIGLGSGAGHGASDTTFMVGKYLTPKLYISYGIGIFDSISTLSLRYTLNSHWKLETQSTGVSTGADLIYTFKR